MSIENGLPLTSATGTYAGNDAVNRAIPHELGVIPKFIYIQIDTAMNPYFISGGVAGILQVGTSYHAVTAPTTANFYVGNATSYPQSANAVGNTYRWVAIV